MLGLGSATASSVGVEGKGWGMENKPTTPHSIALNPEAPIVRRHLPPLGLIGCCVAVSVFRECAWFSPKSVSTPERTHAMVS